MECLSDWCHSEMQGWKKRVLMTMIVMLQERIPKKAKTFFENPSYVIRFTPPFIHSWVASSTKFNVQGAEAKFLHFEFSRLNCQFTFIRNFHEIFVKNFKIPGNRVKILSVKILVAHPVGLNSAFKASKK